MRDSSAGAHGVQSVVCPQVDDPNGRIDILKTGAKYIESTEDFLRRTGHLLERPPTQVCTAPAQTTAEAACT